MAAGINDKFKKVSADNSYAVATTVKTARTVGGGTTLEAFDLSKWADATAVNFLTYRKTTDPVTNTTTVTNRAGWTALVNTGSNTLTNLTIAPGYTDLGQQVGDYIEPVQTSKWANDLVDGILVTHNQDGTLKNKIVTLGKINGGSTDGVLLTDASGNVTGGKVTADKLDFTTLRAELFANQSTSAAQYASLTMTSTQPTGLYFIIAHGSPNFNNTSGDASFNLQVDGSSVAGTVVSRSSSYWEQVVMAGIATVNNGHVVRVTGTSSSPDGSSRNYLRMFRIG